MKCAASLGGTIDILLSRHRLSTRAARRFRRRLTGPSSVSRPFLTPTLDQWNSRALKIRTNRKKRKVFLPINASLQRRRRCCSDVTVDTFVADSEHECVDARATNSCA
jgi:hypothetical protein